MRFLLGITLILAVSITIAAEIRPQKVKDMETKVSKIMVLHLEPKVDCLLGAQPIR